MWEQTPKISFRTMTPTPEARFVVYAKLILQEQVAISNSRSCGSHHAQALF